MPRPYIFIRKDETWIGTFGIFHSRDIFGIELPNGTYYGYSRKFG